MPMPIVDKKLAGRLKVLSLEAEADYVSKGRIITMHNKKTGLVELESVTPSKSKDVIDKIDAAIAQGYGLSNEQLDLLINYAIKYRIGGADEEE
jgi:hypothetical protein